MHCRECCRGIWYRADSREYNDCGHEKNMASRLLELDSASFSRLKERISDKMVSTDLWRGYIGHWEIKNDSLFLDSILVSDNAGDSRRFMPAAISYATGTWAGVRIGRPRK